MPTQIFIHSWKGLAQKIQLPHNFYNECCKFSQWLTRSVKLWWCAGLVICSNMKRANGWKLGELTLSCYYSMYPLPWHWVEAWVGNMSICDLILPLALYSWHLLIIIQLHYLKKTPFSRIWISLDQSRDTKHRSKWALNRRWCHPCLGSTWAHLISKKRKSHKSIDALSFDYCYTIVFLFWMHLNRPFLYSEWPWLSPAIPCSDQNLCKIAEEINRLPRKSWFVDSKTG